MDTIPFIPDQVYHRRNDIHLIYGGNWRGGICPSAKHPYIFIFSDKSGHQHGYEDHWLNQNVYYYTGEGQAGDMEFKRGNLALQNHKQNGKRVFLFESVSKGRVKFKCEVEVFDVGYFDTHDKSGASRIGIKFFFKRKGVYVPRLADLINQNTIVDPLVDLTPSNRIIPPNVTERTGLVTTRVGQGAYRKSIIYRWDCKCAVTGFDKLEVLIASHIVPWSEATDNERLDVDNGLLLSPTYDALFDRHLISFENDGKIILSDKIDHNAYKKIGISGIERIKNLSINNHIYLGRHREHFH